MKPLKVKVKALEGTNQEIFDHVANHLLMQRAPASNEEGTCYYRTPNGNQCAFGCLLTDEEYAQLNQARCESYDDSDTIEGCSSDTVLMLIDKSKVNGEKQELCGDLQQAHDGFARYVNVGAGDNLIQDLTTRLKLVAEAHNLSIAVLAKYSDTE